MSCPAACSAASVGTAKGGVPMKAIRMGAGFGGGGRDIQVLAQRAPAKAGAHHRTVPGCAERRWGSRLRRNTGNIVHPKHTHYPPVMASTEIEALVQQLARLPGLGPRSARRAVLHLMKKRESAFAPLLASLQTVAERLVTCRSGEHTSELQSQTKLL